MAGRIARQKRVFGAAFSANLRGATWPPSGCCVYFIDTTRGVGILDSPVDGVRKSVRGRRALIRCNPFAE